MLSQGLERLLKFSPKLSLKIDSVKTVVQILNFRRIRKNHEGRTF